MIRLIYYKNINTLIRSLMLPFKNYLPKSIKIPVNGSFRVRSQSFPTFNMNANPTSHSAKLLYWNGVEGFEFHAVKIFAHLAKESKCFLDVGSNLGYYSLLASAITNKRIQCFAFEPMPSAFEVLESNIKLNDFDNIHAYKLALSQSKGEATFYMIVNEKFSHFPQLTGDGGLNAIQSGNRAKYQFEVYTDTLDNFVSSNVQIKVDLMKIDTEGNEHFVLDGGHDVLANHRPIIQCEILPTSQKGALLKTLEDKQYKYFNATDKGLIEVDNFDLSNPNFQDYYFVPIEKLNLISRFIV